MPRWPGWALLGIGIVVSLGASASASLIDSGVPVVGDPTTLVWLSLAGAALIIGGLAWLAVRQLRVRRHLPPERYRGPAVVTLLLMSLVVAAVLGAPFVVDATALRRGEGDVSLAGSFALLTSLQLVLLVVSWLFVFRPRALAGWPSWAGPDPAGALLAGLRWGPPAWIGASVVSVAVVWLLERLGIDPGSQAAERALQLVDPWLAVVALVLLAPVAEEVFFRGVVFNAWLRERGRWYAYVGSALLFAVIHLSLVTVIPIFVLGLMLVWIYRRTANLLAPIALHAVFNGISVTLALLVRFEVITLAV